MASAEGATGRQSAAPRRAAEGSGADTARPRKRRGTGAANRGAAGAPGAEPDGAATRSATPRAAARGVTNRLNVGEGIVRRMEQLGDHPLRDAEFFRNADGSQVEQCWGTKGLYIASNASGTWEVAGPFGGGA